MKTSMLVGPAVMLLHKQYTANLDPMYLVYFAVAATGVALAIFAHLYQQIARSQQPGTVTYKSKDSKGRNTEHTVSIKAYDQIELKKLAGKLATGTIFIGGLYLWKQFTQPLVIQPIMSVVQLYESPLVQIHMLGRAAEGPNARPFKEDNPLAALTGGLAGQQEEPAADAAAAAAEPADNSIQKKKS
ncbi:hypothetical protein WJX74_002284 [Apatococcus lobatus]|uniref:Phosphate transporter n=1 Tax=Apatococcus lobatus TaxID=904363 RepID=A0AAW1SD80_9CHLO